MIYFLVYSLLGQSGGSRAGADILRSLEGPDWGITVVCLNRIELPRKIEGNLVPEARWLVLPSMHEDGDRRRLHPRALARHLLGGLQDRHRQAMLDRALRMAPPDLVVHNGFPEQGWANTEIFQRSRNRLLLVHSTPEAVDYFHCAGSSLTRAWASHMLRVADSLMFVSEQLRDAWSEVVPLTGKRVFVVPNTCREGEVARVMALDRSRLRRSLGLPDDGFVVCCVGRVEQGKGQDVLIRALPELVHLLPNLHVVFLGMVTEWGRELSHEVERMGLVRQVVFAGSRDDPYSFIRASDMLVHPSRTEGHAMAVLEAMVLRTPILATNVGGIPSSIEHGVSGWLVPPDDADALVEAFRLLAHDSPLRERLVEAAEARYWARFSTAMHRERIHSMIASCLTAGTR